jgi:hypothetical protein
MGNRMQQATDVRPVFVAIDFAGERLLYRLSTSDFADRFILKGAALLLMWLGEPIRPTKDVDLLGLGDTSADVLRRVFVALCAIDAADDGLAFVADSIRVEPIREDQGYGGMRVKLMARLGNVRIPLQVDVGAGDAVVPPPETAIRCAAQLQRRSSAAVPRFRQTPARADGGVRQQPQKQAQWAPFVRRTRRPDLRTETYLEVAPIASRFQGQVRGRDLNPQRDQQLRCSRASCGQQHPAEPCGHSPT